MKFNEGFIKSIGNRVNVIRVLRYFDANTEENRGNGFKEFIEKNNIIKVPFEIEEEGRSYYLKDYKEIEKKEINFRSDTKENTRYPRSPTGSVRSTYTTGTVVPDEFLSKMNEIYESFNSEKVKKSEIKELYEKTIEKKEKLKKENKELNERIREVELENEKLKNKMKKYKNEPELFFDKLKEKYEDIVDIVIYTKPKKNRVRKHIANGKIY